VLPIGGLKEKALAAQRAGMRRVIAPAGNEADADEVPEHLRDDLEFVFVREVGEVLDAALDDRGARSNGRVYAQRRSRQATRGK
jgi:ATP-dependent Lon protease